MCLALPFIIGGSAVVEGLTFAVVGATLVTFKDEIVEAADKVITKMAENGGASGYSPAVGMATSKGELSSSNTQIKRSVSDQKLTDHVNQEKTKEDASKSRDQKRQQQTQQWKEKEGKSMILVARVKLIKKHMKLQTPEEQESKQKQIKEELK